MKSEGKMSENDLSHDEYINNISELCIKIKPLCSLKSSDNDKEKPFNIILASSDKYYQENYHSDIIKYILDHKKEHTVMLFINYLNTILRADKKEINIEKYQSPVITREKDHIDILIKDAKTKHCIIIENKINDAKDTDRQLPNYYNLLIAQGYTVDKIVYLSLDGNKEPEKSTWEEQDHKLGLDNILIKCAASKKKDTDLIHGFLNKCLLESKTVQENSFFSQYINLLVYLGGNQMDDNLMEKFYERMNESPEEYNTALKIKEMLGHLSTIRNEKSYEKFENNHKPFRDRNPYKTDWVLRNIPDITNENVCLQINSADPKYTKMTFSIERPTVQYDLIRFVLEALGLLKDFNFSVENEYYRDFKFPEEEKTFYNYLKNFLFLLEKDKDKIKNEINKHENSST
jgi:hypothetical protein